MPFCRAMPDSQGPTIPKKLPSVLSLVLPGTPRGSIVDCTAVLVSAWHSSWMVTRPAAFFCACMHMWHSHPRATHGSTTWGPHHLNLPEVDPQAYVQSPELHWLTCSCWLCPNLEVTPPHPTHPHPLLCSQLGPVPFVCVAPADRSVPVGGQHWIESMCGWVDVNVCFIRTRVSANVGVCPYLCMGYVSVFV